MKLVVFTALAYLFAQAAAPSLMTDAQVKTAIADGTAPKARDGSIEAHWMHLPMTAPIGVVHLYSPSAWVAKQAADAKRAFEPFSAEQVNDEMRANVLRVVADPQLPDTMTAKDRASAWSVAKVVLRDAKKERVVQPLSVTPFDVPVANALGAGATYAGAVAVFDVTAVAPLLQDAEFFVTVVPGDDSRKPYDCAVKDKALAALRTSLTK